MLLAVALFSIAGCAKKSLTKSQIRGITTEIVAAAQQGTQHNSEITIRPEMRPASGLGSGRLAFDDIYVSLTDPSQADGLKQAIAGIARRHQLSFTQSSSPGVLRLDLAFNGVRTHTIHLITPLAAGTRQPAEPARQTPGLAIVVDDLGHDRASADSLLALPFPLTISVLPHLPFSAEVAEEAWRRGDQVLLHCPMEPLSEGDPSEGAKPEPIELRVGMNQDEVDSLLSGMLETVPHAIGVNNHEGSRATSDPALMQLLMPALHERGLFFIDSRTTAATVAYDAAERAGVPAASRKVFLDDVPARDAVLAQLDLAAHDAARDGAAIAIGHPRPETVSALAEGVPRLEARGIHLVFASSLVH